MPSLLPGFEYDIFISYRQKDNKYDGWVTEFAGNLKRELEATFKEDISIYFDENPHDGLHETHDVGRSLAGKLKCLIFIPIISQTYCDPKSFAWQHEFCVFNKMAQEDAFGREIKLGNGNVASRILPVKIHHLEQDDKTLLENELGTMLRTVEFIYTTSGVNRPLRPNEEEPKENLNRTLYRNQINKVANSVKEIASSLKNPSSAIDIDPKQRYPLVASRYKGKKVLAVILILTIVTIGGYLAYPALVSLSSKVKNVDKSIAVLPFENLSNDPDQDYFSDGLSDDLIALLGKIPNLKVTGRTSSFQFRNENIGLREIGKELGVGHLLEGSVQKSGNTIRVTIKLIQADDGALIWSETYDNTDIGNALKIQDDIASAIVNKLRITLLNKQSPRSNVIDRDAYDSYLRGRYQWNQRGKGLQESLQYFKKAIEIDPKFDLAYSGLADSYLMMTFLDFMPYAIGIPLCKEAAFKTLELNPNSSEAAATLGFVYMLYEWDFATASQYFQMALRINRNHAPALYWYSLYQIQILANLDSASILAKKAIEVEPLSFVPYTHYGYSFLYKGNYTLSLENSRKAFALDSTNFLARHSLGQAFVYAGQIKEGIKALKMSKDPKELHPWLLVDLSYAYMKAGLKEKAVELFQEGLRRESTDYIQKTHIGMIAANINKYDVALEYLTKGKQNKEGMFLLTKNFLMLNNDFRHDPRFLDLVESLNLPDLSLPVR